MGTPRTSRTAKFSPLEHSSVSYRILMERMAAEKSEGSGVRLVGFASCSEMRGTGGCFGGGVSPLVDWLYSFPPGLGLFPRQNPSIRTHLSGDLLAPSPVLPALGNPLRSLPKYLAACETRPHHSPFRGAWCLFPQAWNPPLPTPQIPVPRHVPWSPACHCAFFSRSD